MAPVKTGRLATALAPHAPTPDWLKYGENMGKSKVDFRTLVAMRQVWRDLCRIHPGLVLNQKQAVDLMHHVARINKQSWARSLTAEEEVDYAQRMAKRLRTALKHLRSTFVKHPGTAWLKKIFDDDVTPALGTVKRAAAAGMKRPAASGMDDVDGSQAGEGETQPSLTDTCGIDDDGSDLEESEPSENVETHVAGEETLDDGTAPQYDCEMHNSGRPAAAKLEPATAVLPPTQMEDVDDIKSDARLDDTSVYEIHGNDDIDGEDIDGEECSGEDFEESEPAEDAETHVGEEDALRYDWEMQKAYKELPAGQRVYAVKMTPGEKHPQAHFDGEQGTTPVVAVDASEVGAARAVARNAHWRGTAPDGRVVRIARWHCHHTNAPDTQQSSFSNFA